MAAICLALALGPTVLLANPKAFNIDSQEATRSLLEFGRQSAVQILFASEKVKGITTNAVHGNYEPVDALRLLLKGTPLIVSEKSDGVLVVEPQVMSRNSSNSRPASVSDEGGSTQLAQSTTKSTQSPPSPDSRQNANVPASQSSAWSESEKDTISEIIVTGTHIRGGNPTIKTKVLDQSYIESTGYASVADLINSLPENAGSGFSPASALLSPIGSAQGNVGETSSVNLRGLGSNSTLVLLNGIRLAPNASGGVVDISAIPLSAVQRVEILPDGASAIYGSDAVGGVVNFVLDREFQGALTSAQYGASPSGAPSETRVSQKLGTQWSGGGGMIAYEYYDRSALDSQDRSFSSTIPPGFSLLPTTHRNSLVSSLHQDLTESISFTADGLYSSTRTTLENSYYADTFEDSLGSLSLDGALDWQINSNWNGAIVLAFGKQSDHNQSISASSGDTDAQYYNTVLSAALRLDGTVFRLPAGPVKLASGLEIREEKFKVVSAPDPTLSPSRTVDAGYLELLIPVLGDRSQPWGAVDADFAVRAEHYSDFGGTTNPKAGISWQNPQLHIRANWGTSYQAPTFFALDAPNYSVLADLPDPTTGGTTRSLAFFGGNPNLRPQSANTWAAAFDYTPTSLPGLQIGANYFNIDYKHRIETPEGGESLFDVLPNESALGPAVVRNPSTALISQLLSRSGTTIYNLLGPAFSGEPYTPDQFKTLIYFQNLNLASSSTDGIDAHAAYELDTRFGRFRATIDSTYILDLQSRVTNDSPVLQELNRLFYSPALKARTGLNWSDGAITTAVFFNYTGHYLNTTVTPPQPIRDSKTIDLTLRYSADEFVRGLAITASVRNLFDEMPPPVITPSLYQGGQFGFDPTNGDPIGRFVSLAITKKW